MVLRLKRSGATYELQDTKGRQPLLKAEWVIKAHSLNDRKFEAKTLILKNPDDSTFAEAYLKPKKSFLSFEWNDQYILTFRNQAYILYCASFWKRLWKLRAGTDCFLYKKGFWSLRPQVFKNDDCFLNFDDDLISASKKASLEAIKTGVTIHLNLNKPWIEVVF